MTKYQIAKKLRISPQAVYAWYNGISFPATKHLIQLSKILNLPVEAVLASFTRKK